MLRDNERKERIACGGVWSERFETRIATDEDMRTIKVKAANVIRSAKTPHFKEKMR